MKRFVFKKKEIIPSNYREDTKRLQEFIRSHLDIEISLYDTYTLWDSISDDWGASWLNIETHYEDMTRKEFLLYEMNKRGNIIES